MLLGLGGIDDFHADDQTVFEPVPVADTRVGDQAAVGRVVDDLVLSAVVRSHPVSFPFGEDCDYDLVVDRDGHLERVQVKYADSKGHVIRVQCYSSSLTNGKVKHRKPYTRLTVDWIAVYDPATNRCYYVSSEEFADGRYHISLRVATTENSQRKGIRFAEDYLELAPPQPRIVRD
jgi:PD-(D/E)XK endonuclease